MQSLFENGINLLETFLFTEFMTRYFGTKFKGARKYACFAVAWLLAFVFMCVMNYVVVVETVATVGFIILYFVYAMFCLNGKWQTKLLLSAVTYYLAYAIGILTNLTVCNVIGYDPVKMATVFNGVRISCVIFTKIVFAFITEFILNRKRRALRTKNVWLLVAVIPTVSLVSLGALLKATLYHEDIQVYIWIVMVGIVFADAIIYYFFTALGKEYEQNLNMKLLELEKEASEKYIKDMDVFVKEMRTVRHDIKNQLCTVQAYLSEGKTEEAKAYVETLTEEYLPHMLGYVSTDNDAFNAIVNTKAAQCSDKHIAFQVNVRRETSISLAPTDTAALLGNLLDNAIEAASETEHPQIILDVHNDGEYLTFEISNTIKESVLDSNGSLETTKSDKDLHGIGTKSVREIVERYNGMLKYYERDGMFICHIMLLQEKIK